MVTVDPDAPVTVSPATPPGGLRPSGAARQPTSPGHRTDAWRLEAISPNPYNRRDPRSNEAKFDELKHSMAAVGQLAPCAAVTREAFERIFPDDGAAMGSDVRIVQVMGGRRLAAAAELAFVELDCHVNDALARDRRTFLAATGRENFDRADLDPVEEAEQVDLLVRECGSGKDAAAELGRTAAWVTQRTNLLRLNERVRGALHRGELPVRACRQWHRLTADAQDRAMADWQRRAIQRRLADGQHESRLVATTEGAVADGSEGDSGEDKIAGSLPSTRVITAALRRLGGTPSEVGRALRSTMSPVDRRSLAAELLVDAGEE